MQKVLLFVALILAIGWLIMRILRGNPKATAVAAPELEDKSSPYHAVSLRYSSNACGAAKAMTGRRFLSSAAPRLPLPECDSLECRCQFSHHSDRRSGADRRSPFSPATAGGGTGTFKAERRQKQDRRESADLDDS